MKLNCMPEMSNMDHMVWMEEKTQPNKTWMLYLGPIKFVKRHSRNMARVHQKSLIGYPFVQEKTSPISRLLLYATLSAFL